ncbi:MAG TPA: OmpA family protein [Thermoanaerobaculia bacterium]|nr:OmpA family protein [Thermoanaerobaculia bacterium]
MSLARWFRFSPLLLSCLLAACTSTRSRPAGMMAEVITEPAGIEVSFRGKTLGPAPLHLEIDNLAEAAAFSAAQSEPPVVERRVRVLSLHQVQVLIRVGGEPSPLAQRLGLSRVLVFEQGEATTFDLDRYELKSAFTPLLAEQAKLLAGPFAKLDVYVCGHTDATGEADHNRILSLRRAEAVSSFLVAHGVARSRLRTQGFAADYPVAGNDTDEGRALNRRTEIVLPD